MQHVEKYSTQKRNIRFNKEFYIFIKAATHMLESNEGQVVKSEHGNAWLHGYTFT